MCISTKRNVNKDSLLNCLFNPEEIIMKINFPKNKLHLVRAHYLDVRAVIFLSWSVSLWTWNSNYRTFWLPENCKCFYLGFRAPTLVSSYILLPGRISLPSGGIFFSHNDIIGQRAGCNCHASTQACNRQPYILKI